MGRISVKKKDDTYIVANTLTKPEAINENESKAIAEGRIEGLLPVFIERRKRNTWIQCTVVGMDTLHTHFSGIVSKKTFLESVLQIIRIVKECESNKMNPNNLLLDMDYIFLNPRTKEIKCIYQPIVNNQNAGAPSYFFEEIPYQLVFNKHEDHKSYLSGYVTFIKSVKPFSINGLERLVMELLGKRVESGHVPSGSTEYGGECHKEIISSNLNEKSGNIEYDPKRNRNQPDACKGEEVTNHKYDDTCVLGTNHVKGGTAVIGLNNEEASSFPYLTKTKTLENVYVDKPAFRIGKDRNDMDLIISDNEAVSRSHAEIVMRDGRYYIRDLNSTNKTYIDDCVISANHEVELFSGTRIRMANEEFTFYL